MGQEFPFFVLAVFSESDAVRKNVCLNPVMLERTGGASKRSKKCMSAYQ